MKSRGDCVDCISGTNKQRSVQCRPVANGWRRKCGGKNKRDVIIARTTCCCDDGPGKDTADGRVEVDRCDGDT